MLTAYYHHHCCQHVTTTIVVSISPQPPMLTAYYHHHCCQYVSTTIVVDIPPAPPLAGTRMQHAVAFFILVMKDLLTLLSFGCQQVDMTDRRTDRHHCFNSSRICNTVGGQIYFHFVTVLLFPYNLTDTKNRICWHQGVLQGACPSLTSPQLQEHALP